MPREKHDPKTSSSKSVSVIKPSPKLRGLYHDYLALFLLGAFLWWFIPVIVYLTFTGCFELLVTLTMWSSVFVLPILVFTVYWIAKYTASLKFELTQNEIVVNKGVWWKKKHYVPYNRITNIDTDQGPLSRHLSIGKVDFQTAGYSGTPGGGRRTEASIWGVEDFEEIKEAVLRSINKIQPSIAVESRHPEKSSTAESLLRAILVELKRIGKERRR